MAIVTLSTPRCESETLPASSPSLRFVKTRFLNTKPFLWLALLLLSFVPFSVSLRAQTYYAALPNTHIQFFDASGNPLSAGKVYTYQAGTTTPQATYSDPTRATANANPVVLDSAGRAALASNNPYKLILKTSAEVIVWTQDNLSDLGVESNRDLQTSFATQNLPTQLASSSGAQIGAAISDVASRGGVVSAIGNQAWSSNPFTGVTEPVTLEFGTGTTTISTDLTVPPNVTLRFRQGSILSVNSGNTVTINGPIEAPVTRIFSGAGRVLLSPQSVIEILPQWWGAKGDGILLADVSIIAGSTTMTSVSGTCSSADIGKPMAVIGGAASSQVLTTSITGCLNATQYVMANAAGRTASRLNARYATDDTAAIDAAIVSAISATDTGYQNLIGSVYFAPGHYGFSTIRLGAGIRFHGAGHNSALWRLAVGTSGPAIAMRTGAIADRLHLSNFTLENNMTGAGESGLDGINLGTETPGTTDFAYGSSIRNVFVHNASGYNLKLQANVGLLDHLWLENGYGYAYQAPTAKAVVLTAASLTVNNLNVEGSYPGGWITCNCANSQFNGLQIEKMGTGGAQTFVTVAGSGNVFLNSYLISGYADTHFFKLNSGSNNARIVSARYNNGGTGTLTHLLEDTISNQNVTSPLIEITFWDRISLKTVAHHTAQGMIGMTTDQDGVDAVTTYLSAGIGAMNHPDSNNAINIQEIHDGGTRKRYVMMNGSLGSTATAAKPTFTTAGGAAGAVVSDGTSLSLQVSAPGTNVTPLNAMDISSSGTVTMPGRPADASVIVVKNDLGNTTAQIHQDADKSAILDLNTSTGAAGIRLSANGSVPSYIAPKLTVGATSSAASTMRVVGLPIYANNAAAVAGGLSPGDLYRSGGDPDVVAVVH